MRTPIRTMAHNIRWTRGGTVWADWIIRGLPYGLKSNEDKEAVRSLHQGLYRALPSESMLLSLCSGLDPATIVAHMLEGVDPDQCPEWAEECRQSWDSLELLGPGRRVHWLSIPLGANSARDRLWEPIRAGASNFRDMVGLPRAIIAPEEIERRVRQAQEISSVIPAPFEPSPATPAQRAWLHQHMCRRGLFQDLDLPDSAHDAAEQEYRPTSAAALLEPLLDEGGKSDLKGMSRREKATAWIPSKRRYLKVTDACAPPPAPDASGETVDEEVASYQAMLPVVGVPENGMVFPGSEILGRIDGSGQNVDYAVRISSSPGTAVEVQNRRALRNLNEQYDQREGETSHAYNTLDRAAASLAELVAKLEEDQLEVEMKVTMIFAVGAPDPKTCLDQARALSSYLSQAKYTLSQPLGSQLALWWAMHPGVPPSEVVRQYEQISTSSDFSTLVPFTSSHLGDNDGSLFAVNISNGPLFAENVPCGPTSVVLHDLEGSADRQESGSVAVGGELGGGKTATLMKLAGDVFDRGGHGIILDRTKKGEWSIWASSVARAQEVDVADPKCSLDPLRLFGPVIGSRMMQTFLTPLLNVPPTSPMGVLLADVLDKEYLAEFGITSSGDLVPHLTSRCKLNGAEELARLINVFARKDLGRVIFDGSLPPLDLANPAVVIRTNQLELPSREELDREHLFKQLVIEKIIGRALHALIASIARYVCFRDTSQLALFVISECHAVTASFEGERELIEFVRDGRKHRAAALIDIHDAENDLPSDSLRSLIPTRLLMRTSDERMARRGLRWLGADPDNKDLVKLVTKDTSPRLDGNRPPLHRRGEALMRDTTGSIGRIKVLLPATEARRKAIDEAGMAAERAAVEDGDAA